MQKIKVFQVTQIKDNISLPRTWTLDYLGVKMAMDSIIYTMGRIN